MQNLPPTGSNRQAVSPFDLILSKFTDVHRNGDRAAMVRCPAHKDDTASLSIKEGDDGRVLLHDFGNCPPERIVSALGLELRDLFPARAKPPPHEPTLTIRALAAAKGFDPDFLIDYAELRDVPNKGVAIPYRDAKGIEKFAKIRTRLTKGKNKFFYPKDARMILYGLPLLAPARNRGRLLLTEGETDAWSFWCGGIPALGIPGSTLIKVITAAIVKGFPLIVCARDADDVGVAMAENIRKRLDDLNYEGNYRVIAPPSGFKDFNEFWHRECAGEPGKFTATIENLIALAADPQNLNQTPPGSGLRADAGESRGGEKSVAATEKIEDDEKSQPDFAALPFRPVGFDRAGRYYFWGSSSQLVKSFSGRELGQSGVLLAIHPKLSWWQTTFPSESARGDFVNWRKAQTAITRAGDAIGLYDARRVRGRGFWKDQERTVLHAGDRIVSDGRAYAFADFPTKCIYDIGLPLDFDADRRLSDADASEVSAIARAYQWDREITGTLLAGWIVIAPFCGLLEWRPHLWILTNPRTGKTTLLEKFIVPLLGGFAYYMQGSTTEAGIRQRVTLDALPVVIDEVDPTDKRNSADRVRGIIGLMRASSSNAGAEVVKGSSGGLPQWFGLNSAYLLASVTSGIEQEADESRITTGSFAKFDDKKKWTALEKRIQQIATPANGAKLIARTFALLPAIRANMAIFADALMDKFGDARTAQQLAPLIAAGRSLIDTKVVTPEFARRWIDGFDWGLTVNIDAGDREDNKLIAHLSEWQIGVMCEDAINRRFTVGELIAYVHGRRATPDRLSAANADMVLRRHGFWVVGNDRAVRVSNTNSEIAAYLERTVWGGNWASVLRRHEGATAIEPRGGFGRSWEIPDWPDAGIWASDPEKTTL